MILLLAILFFASWIDPASADPLGLIVTGLAGVLGGGAVGTTIARAVVGIALYFGVNYISRQLAGEPKPQGVSGTFSTGGVVPRSFAMGRVPVEGSLVYHGTWKNDNNVPNEYYVRVIALSDMPITGLVEIWVDGKKASYNPNASQTGIGAVLSDYTVDGKPHMWVRFKDGTQGSADDYLMSKFGSHGNYPIDNNFIGTGVAYVIMTCRANDELFQGLPEFRFVVDGIKLYDPRKDTTVGGSGTHRWSSKGTWEYSRNPVLMIYNILMGLSQNGSWFYGLQKMVQPRLPATLWFAAANKCDESVGLKDGGSEPRYRAGMEVNIDVQPADTIERLLTACNGRLAETGGYYKPFVGSAGAATIAITDDDIAISDEQTFSPFFSIGESINGVTASFLSPSEGWVLKDIPPLYNTTYEQEDDGRRLLADVTYDMVSSKTQAQRLTKAALKEARRARRHTFVLTGGAVTTEPLDFLQFDSVRNGYVAKLFRVDGVTYRSNLDVLVDITEVHPSDYDWSVSLDEVAVTEGIVAVDVPPVQIIKDWNAISVRIPGADGRELAGIRLSWDGTMADIRGVRFQVRLTSNNQVVRDDTTESYDAGTLDITGNINGATAYQVRGKYLPKSDRRTDWGNWISLTTPDVRLNYNQMDAAIQSYLDKLRLSGVGTLNDLINRVNALAAEVDTKNHVFYQNDPPVSTPSLQLQTGDLWFDANNNNAQSRWSGTQWEPVASSVGLKTYYGNDFPTGNLNVGDLFIDANDSNKLYRWDGSWKTMRDTQIEANRTLLLDEIEDREDADGVIYSALNAVQSRFSVKSRVFTQNEPPTTGPTITTYSGTPPVASTTTEPLRDGDLWFDTNDKNRMYKYTISAGVGSWKVVPDGNKNKVFMQTTQPPSNTVGLAVGDIWIDTTKASPVPGAPLVPKNTMYRWSGSAWDTARDIYVDTVMGAVGTEAKTRAKMDGVAAGLINFVWTEMKKITAGGFFELRADNTSARPPEVVARFTVFLNYGSAVNTSKIDDPIYPVMDTATGEILTPYSPGASSFQSAGFYLEIYNEKYGQAVAPVWKSRALFDVSNFVIGSSSKKVVRPFIYSSETGVLQLQSVKTDKLSSLSANLGTVTLGKMTSSNGAVVFDLDNAQLLFFEK